jgi:hypothetical protein
LPLVMLPMMLPQDYPKFRADLAQNSKRLPRSAYFRLRPLWFRLIVFKAADGAQPPDPTTLVADPIF